MSDESTIKFIRSYMDRARPTAFFAGMFQTPAENFHESKDVELDIERNGEDVAVAVQAIGTGYRANSTDIFTNKKFTPPVFKEKFGVSSEDLINRDFGNDPFQNPIYLATLVRKVFSGMRKIEDKIRRANELQASQVLQTGTAQLVDESGNTIYSIDYKPKATHFPTTGNTWDPSATNIQSDLLSLANVIRADGKNDPNMLIFGESAFQAFINNTQIQDLYDNRRIDIGNISQQRTQGNGGTFQGIIKLGGYNFEMWTYSGRYTDIQTGNSTKFLDDDKVIMKSTSNRFDATFGAIPNIGELLGQGRNILPQLPRRFGSSPAGLDMSVNVWLSEAGEEIYAGVGTRPLYIPTAIDTYGCLDTVV